MTDVQLVPIRCSLRFAFAKEVIFLISHQKYGGSGCGFRGTYAFTRESLTPLTSISDTSHNNRAAAYYSLSACRMSYKTVNFIVAKSLF